MTLRVACRKSTITLQSLSKLLFPLLFCRLYQVRCSLKVSPGKLPVQIETCIPDQNANNQTTGPCIINGAGVSKVFQILYRNEEISLRDVIMFRAHLLGNLKPLRKCLLEVYLMTAKWHCINHDEMILQFITSSLSCARIRNEGKSALSMQEKKNIIRDVRKRPWLCEKREQSH